MSKNKELISEKEGLKERTRWAINYVCEKKRYSNKTLAPVLEINKDTINSYRQRRTIPSLFFVFKFCREFKINPLWWFDGVGEPFPGARKKYSEICGPEPEYPPTPEPPRPKGQGETQFVEAVGWLKEIFDSNDPGVLQMILADLKTLARGGARRETDLYKKLESRMDRMEKLLEERREHEHEHEHVPKKAAG